MELHSQMGAINKISHCRDANDSTGKDEVPQNDPRAWKSWKTSRDRGIMEHLM